MDAYILEDGLKDRNSYLDSVMIEPLECAILWIYQRNRVDLTQPTQIILKIILRPALNCVIFYLFNIESITAIMPINRIYILQRKRY